MAATMFKQYDMGERPYLTMAMVKQKVIRQGLKRYGNKIIMRASESEGRLRVEKYDLVKCYPNYVVMRHAKHGFREAFLYMDLYQRLVG